MKVLVTGGTGFVGTSISSKLAELGYAVTCLASRPPKPGPPKDGIRFITADTTRPGDWQRLVPEHEVAINLAGRSVFHLWSAAYKRQIHDSRILTTRNLVAAMEQGANQLLLSASAAGFYGDGGEVEKDEQAAPGTDFLAEVCTQWEAEALKARDKGVRVCLTRFGVILGRGGGAVATMKTPFMLALGGPIGSGRQWFPWIHLQDVIDALVFLLQGDALEGPFNFTAPESVRQKEFARALGRVLHRPALLPAPAVILKMILGEFGQSLLQSQRVRPGALLDSGYAFRFPTLKAALEDILGP